VTEHKSPPRGTTQTDWGSVALNPDTLAAHEQARLGDMSARRRSDQREKRDRYFLKGPIQFDWIQRNTPDAASRLILIAKAFMDMDGLDECVLSAKVWDCAGIEGKDARQRVLRKIRSANTEFEVLTRPGRPSLLRKLPASPDNCSR
jgi:hypothetical protein